MPYDQIGAQGEPFGASRNDGRALRRLLDELGRLPGIGPKSAQRIAYHILGADAEDVLHGVVDNVDQTKEDQQGDQHRQAAAGRIIFFTLVELLQLLVHLCLVFGVHLLDLLHLRLDGSHLGRRFLLLDGQRHQNQSDQQRKQDQRPAVAVQDIVQQAHDQP